MSKRESIMARVMDLMAVHYDRRAILRGGMVIRLLGVPRYTNDLDYLIIPHKSKKELVPEILNLLGGIEGAKLSHSFNSKCLRITLNIENETIQVEAKVSLHAQSTSISNEAFAVQYGYPIRVIAVHDFSVALANKMAAWNERRLSRDLYDIYFYLQQGVFPDQKTLEARLENSEMIPSISKTDYFTEKSPDSFYRFLHRTVLKIDGVHLERDLSSILPPERYLGIKMRLLAQLSTTVLAGSE